MKLWEKVRPGQPPKFKTPDDMWQLALEYFKDCGLSDLSETKAMNVAGSVEIVKLKKMHAMSQQGLCCYLNCSIATYHNYKAKPEFLEVTSLIDSIMFEQKFAGASAGLLNANIIARDLGLADKQEITHSEDLTPWGKFDSGVDE